LLEEGAQAPFGAVEIVLRVHRPQDLVLADLLVEAVDERGEGGRAADLVVEGGRLLRSGHAPYGARSRGRSPMPGREASGAVRAGVRRWENTAAHRRGLQFRRRIGHNAAGDT